MPYVAADDGVRLYYEETGSGEPVLFIHEFAGDHRSWEPQLRYFARFYRAIAYNARGYPPSDVPAEVERYGQARATDDAAAVLRGLGIAQAHVVGLSMGGFATLHFGFRHPAMARSLVIAGCGYGAAPQERAAFQAEYEAMARRIEADGMAEVAKTYAVAPARVQLQNKDPRGWQEFADRLAQHSTPGSAATLRGVQIRRPSLWDLRQEMRLLAVPTLIVTGDEDESCLEPALLMKRNIRTAGLAVLPKSGHVVNLEEPDLFNRMLLDFFHAVEHGRWRPRDPRARGARAADEETVDSRARQ
ncbi:MAG TPA: alpha/beta hydrolase [Stellaceae bacterium]|nr:alpha/beta hydrolase [Stellaceae bacterium]